MMMKRTIGALAFGLAAIWGASGVTAAQEGDVTAPERDTVPEPGLPEAAPAGPRAPGLEPAPRPQGTVGSVVGIDRDEGIAVVATPRGLIALRGSPKEMSNLSVGDRIELVEPGEAPPPPSPSPRSRGNGATWL
jgi:hypothetical protein